MDPIKDGVNWYVYVNADPVNFVDAWGLLALPAGNGAAREPDPFRNPGYSSEVLITAYGPGDSQRFGSLYTGQRAQSPVRFESSISQGPAVTSSPDPSDYLMPIGPNTMSGVRCDQIAAYCAFDNGFDPRDDSNERIDFDNEYVSRIFGRFDEDGKYDAPPVDTGGFVFDEFDAITGLPGHMEHYVRIDDSVTIWVTPGTVDPEPQSFSADDLPIRFDDAVWVPRPVID